MVLSQRPMMLAAAQEFTRAIGEKSVVTWDEPEALAAYIGRLRTMVEKLSQQNRTLRKHHISISEKVQALMTTDLLTKQQRWKDSLNEIRILMAQLSEQGFAAENMRPWRAHWDRQLYKALEYQYLLCLETLVEHLPEIRVDLTYRNASLQYRPPLEEVRAKYYQQLKKFLAIPVQFRGVSDDISTDRSLIFSIIVERNSHQYLAMYRRAEQLFINLEGATETIKDWVALGSMNIEDLIEGNCVTADDWKRNLRVIKARSQEFSKLSLEEEKFECVVVNYAPVRAYVDYLLSDLEQGMIRVLQRSIMADAQLVQKFLQEATTSLTARPQTAQEVADLGKRSADIVTTREQLLSKYKDADAKNEILSRWSRKSIAEVAHLQSQWDMLDRMLEEHRDIVSRQVDILKANMASKVQNFESDLERYGARWHHFKPQNEVTDMDAAAVEKATGILKEMRVEFDALLKTKEALIVEAKQFGVPEPDISLLTELESELHEAEEMWHLFEEFQNELKELTQEEWIITRGKLHKYENFLSDWTHKMKEGSSATTVTAVLYREIDSQKDLLGVLKYCRGEVFSPQHWAEFFQITSIEPIAVEKLTFADILKSKKYILNNKDQLKDLNSRAQGEVTIREALNELDVWSSSARFSLTDHKDSLGNDTKIIKDWSDILSKVGDLQCLVQSLKDSRYYERFADRAILWEQRLQFLDQALKALNQNQRRWLYLDPILGRGALPSEAVRFQNLSDDFRAILDSVAKDDRIVLLANIPGLLSTLNNLTDQLGRCQRALNQFLELKRSKFPRFYFLGDEDLLEILGQATKPSVIQAHLKKLFSGIHTVELDELANTVVAMQSLDGENVPLDTPVHIASEVELWLSELALQMKVTLKKLLLKCLDSRQGGTTGGEDPSKYPSQKT
ncbi:cytoplasmic dynein 2 heavy chain 1-like [Ornithodoros turicata]|uniref:cytoplasmic dynein 2 heavy chain 1-like n=1 Tax=Ornithodoros turicata TaxID=34597 RepID=UPI00313A11D3